MFYIASNLFNRKGILELNGDEEEINRSKVGYATKAKRNAAIDDFENQYPDGLWDYGEAYWFKGEAILGAPKITMD